ncbi:MAG: glycerophosphodiester phosphodiesterase family protein [Ferrimicrobium sp.]
MTAISQPHMVRIAAHRGGLGEAVASSGEAFRRAALELGVDLELDVHPTADGELVVFHDDRLDPSTNAFGWIHDFTVDQLRADVDLSNGSASTRVEVVTLGEVLALSGDAMVSIDIKEDLGPESWVEEKVGSVIEGYRATHRVVVASFLDAPLRRFRSLFPAIVTAASSNESIGWYQNFHNGVLSQPEYRVLSLPVRLMGVEYLTPELVAWAHRQDIAVWVWTVNQEEDLRRMRDMGFDTIVTDYPARALAVLGG